MKPLREKIFDSQKEKKFFDRYESFFSIKEIENSQALLWVFGATIFSYFTAFSSWIYSFAMSVNSITVCRPYFQSCNDWHFLTPLPYGYSQMMWYMGMFFLLGLAVWLLYKKDYVLAHITILPVAIWHFLGVYVFTGSLSGNYEYYLAIFAITLLFLPHKQFFLKFYLVLFYFLSTTIKIHEGWILGTYFSALNTGLPVFPDWSIAIMVNIVIVMQMVFAWFVFSKNTFLRNWAIFFFFIFHLYSGIIVGFRYPSVVLPTLFILYIMFYKYQKFPVDKKSIVGWLIALLLIGIQFISVIIPGDEKLTLEGNQYGLYMFEANHQCISTIKIYRNSGGKAPEVIENQSESARNRCDPYRYWFTANKGICLNENTEKISWTFDHSINGEPFLRIVDTKNICDLEYKAFDHNEWIKIEKDNPEIIGYPVQNHYR